MTFFCYFPTTKDVALSDSYDAAPPASDNQTDSHGSISVVDKCCYSLLVVRPGASMRIRLLPRL
jgi:hypothetical protein